MAAYQYQALDQAGQVRQGALEGDSPRHIRALLREQGLIALAVEAANQSQLGKIKVSWRTRRLFSAELTLITRQFASLLAAKLPIEHALNALIQQTEQPAIRSVLVGVRAEVLAGQSLGQALLVFQPLFPDLYCALVKAGEQSGHLDGILLNLAQYLEDRQALAQKIMLALVYPIILTCVALGIVSLLLVYVVPQIVGVFTQTHQTLPLLTRCLISLSQFLQQKGMGLALGLGLLGMLLRVLWHQPRLRYRWHVFLLRLPVVGKLLLGIHTTRFASTLAILVGGGVPLLAALQTCAQMVENLPLREAITQAAHSVREGMPLNRALAQTRRFPPIFIHMLASGEASGQLEAMLNRVAQQHSSEVTLRLAWLISLLEPALILLMGGLVLVIVLAILLPIIEMNQLIHL